MKLLRFCLVLLLVSACNRQSEVATPDVDAAPGKPGSMSAVVIVHNAVIHTVNAEQDVAEAMAFNGDGEILQLGAGDELDAAYPGAELRDLQGRTVIPGLIDSHGHLYGLAVSLSRAQLVGTTSKEDVIRRLKAHESRLESEAWLLGMGWDQNDWPQQEFPSRHDLDQHFPDRPVWLIRIDGHAGWANSVALALADRDLGGDWQIEGGYIHRDAHGQATGVLIDGARALIDPLVPATSEELLDGSLGLALQQMVSLGLTGVHDPGVNRSTVAHYLRRIEMGTFPTRVYAMADGVGDTLDWLCRRGAIKHASGRLVMRAAKIYQDGALGSRGAALLRDYVDDPGNNGLLFLQPDALQAQLRKIMDCGFQAAVHAIGDRANRVVLDAYESVIPDYPDNPGRHRVEHVQILSGDDLARFAELGIIAAMQPTHATSDMYWAEERVGPEGIRFAYAWRSLLDSGAHLALGSDFPVEAVNPMFGIYAAVARKDLQGWPGGGWYPAESMTRAQALRGFTLDAARAAFMEQRVGSLEPGKRADFVILDRDIMTVPEADIPATVVLETWLDGERVYARP